MTAAFSVVHFILKFFRNYVVFFILLEAIKDLILTHDDLDSSIELFKNEITLDYLN